METFSVVILSAGPGFRLNPFTLHRPKALCKVANITLLERLFSQLQAGSFNRCVLALPATASGMQNLAAAVAPPGLDLTIIFPRDANFGKVSLVRQAIGSDPSPVLVIYGDSLLSANLRELVETHQRNRAKGALATILYHRPADLRIAEKDGQTYHGVLSVDPNGRMTRFVEKPKVVTITAGFDLANAAVFVIERELLDRPDLQHATDFSFEIFQPAIARGWPIFGCDIGQGFRFDVGGIARWHQLNLQVIRKEIDVVVPGKEIAPNLWAGEGIMVSSARLEPPALLGDKVCVGAGTVLGPDVVVGNGCRIGAGAVIRRSVIMDHCCIGRNTELDLCLLGSHCKIAGGVKLPQFSVLGSYSVVGDEHWPNWAEEKDFQYE